MLDQGLWLESVDGERVVLMQYYRYTQHFQLQKGTTSREPNVLLR
jgi:hypothetical protein